MKVEDLGGRRFRQAAVTHCDEAEMQAAAVQCLDPHVFSSLGLIAVWHTSVLVLIHFQFTLVQVGGNGRLCFKRSGADSEAANIGRGFAALWEADEDLGGSQLCANCSFSKTKAEVHIGESSYPILGRYSR